MTAPTTYRDEFLDAVRELRIDRGTWVPQSEAFVQTRGDGEPDYNEVAAWSRDGILWADAPAPPKHHKHFVQTYGVDGLRQIFRCPCGAIGGNIAPSWVLLDPPRVAPDPVAVAAGKVRRWWKR